MKKIDPEVREALMSAAAIKEYAIGIHERWFEKAEEILNRPKYSSLQDKVAGSLLAKATAFVGNEPHYSIDAVMKALEGIVELPETATRTMAIDFANTYPVGRHVEESCEIALDKVFDNIRKGRYQ